MAYAASRTGNALYNWDEHPVMARLTESRTWAAIFFTFYNALSSDSLPCVVDDASFSGGAQHRRGPDTLCQGRSHDGGGWLLGTSAESGPLQWPSGRAGFRHLQPHLLLQRRSRPQSRRRCGKSPQVLG